MENHLRTKTVSGKSANLEGFHEPIKISDNFMTRENVNFLIFFGNFGELHDLCYFMYRCKNAFYVSNAPDSTPDYVIVHGTPSMPISMLHVNSTLSVLNQLLHTCKGKFVLIRLINLRRKDMEFHMDMSRPILCELSVIFFPQAIWRALKNH